MGRWISWLIEINKTMTNVVLDGPLQRRAAGFKRSVVTRSHYHAMVVLEVKKEHKLISQKFISYQTLRSSGH